MTCQLETCNVQTQRSWLLSAVGLDIHAPPVVLEALQCACDSVIVQGSGWGWLGYNKASKALEIATCANQDPLATKVKHRPGQAGTRVVAGSQPVQQQPASSTWHHTCLSCAANECRCLLPACAGHGASAGR